MYSHGVLADLLQFRNGKKRSNNTGTIPVYGGNGILGYSTDYNYEDCIIIGRVGAYCGSVYRQTGKCWVSDNAIAAIPQSNVSADFAFYLLQSLRLNAHHIGTSQPLLTQEILNRIDCIVPDYPIQLRIASVLTAVDAKIEANTKINDNLLQQAMTLFVHTFIENPPCGESRPLYDFADYINGAAFKQDDYSASGLPIIKIAELKNGITDSTQFFAGDKGEKYLIHDKDILFSWSGNPDTSIDVFIWASGDAILNQHTFNVKSKEGFRWFVYLMLKYFKPQFAQIASNKQTTGLGHVTAADLKRLTFIYGRDEIASFEEMIGPTMEMVFSNMLENHNLISLRDSLLPRLMSGEIDVSDVTI